jgi:ubiquitin-conjugating enzyme E2 O
MAATLLFHQRCGFHSLNPNLTPYGGVCLSLLNKTMGNKKECWIPRVSTVLQVLVSIQGLVLTAHPMYNSSGHYDLHKKGGPIRVTYLSWRYNEKAFIASLWTMIHIIIRPPKV